MIKYKVRFHGLLSSMVRDDIKYGLSGTDLEVINFIYAKRRVNIKEICKFMKDPYYDNSEYISNHIIRYLIQLKIIKKINEDEYILLPKGKKVTIEIHKSIPKKLNIISGDQFLFSLAVGSGTIVE